jgi:hypothetical protein
VKVPHTRAPSSTSLHGAPDALTLRDARSADIETRRCFTASWDGDVPAHELRRRAQQLIPGQLAVL